MKALQIQGRLFCAIAVSGALASRWLPSGDSQAELILVTVLIIGLGVPHGALDTIYAREVYGVSTPMTWVRFAAAYLLLGALVVGLWILAPAVFLAGFLLISIAHFSGDPEGACPGWVRVAQGGAIIFLPMITHAPAISELFGLLIGVPAGPALAGALSWLAWPWLILAATALGYLAWRRSAQAWELGAIMLLALWVPPLLAFTLFFCGMHSARHILRTARFAQNTSLRFLWGAALLPMVGVGLLTVAAWVWMPDQTLSARLVQIIFVGLAALTVPHMALVEPVRVRGWIKGPASPR
jgi:Brp/Blh family beta-carotene 15,15'-monooxygenase